ncbi:hypothetical protein U1Q18_026003, partial [Sarracenia purpurea var. burkii]
STPSNPFLRPRFAAVGRNPKSGLSGGARRVARNNPARRSRHQTFFLFRFLVSLTCPSCRPVVAWAKTHQIRRPCSYPLCAPNKGRANPFDRNETLTAIDVTTILPEPESSSCDLDLGPR